MIALQRQGRIGFYGPCTGQEAVVIGAAFASDPEDWVFPALRESAILLVRGFSLTRYLAQVFGNAEDVQKGRQMPSHMSARSHHVVSWSSSVATQLPHAVGAAWAAKRAGQSVAVFGFVGDGGTSHPDFHAAMNFAGVFKTPCVIVCQNNHYAISTKSTQQTASATFAIKARAYGMPGIRVDGNDVLAVYRALSDARRRAADGGGPSLVECVTYRMGAHSSSDDPTRYQPVEELRSWAARDPIDRFRRHLQLVAAVDDRRDAELDQELEREIKAAVAHAESIGPPTADTLFEDVYATVPAHLEEQRRELLAGPRPA
jgi:pyruvate dehydrogenase E1 component alpha subunit/2-oxoisovalerate dehydrogenase E1 component alpha subunit